VRFGIAYKSVNDGGNAFALRNMLSQFGRCLRSKHDGDLLAAGLSPNLAAAGLAVTGIHGGPTQR
jgi:hypothetical protein